MSNIAIRAENIGKMYEISHNVAKRGRQDSLRDVLTHNALGLAKKTRDIFTGRTIPQSNEIEEFWALKNINFEIPQGGRIGIIGRNGAGKSTLLKILSRITEPTNGKIIINGRVASLLEVGTGFHPELTGRENIYLNGAILGMSRSEVRRKFDEIVDFAGVEKFLDTPVKRYSSGMYVRLAFAVAAHLDPEILIVDEVLAVGDADFQKKCLGKMEDFGKSGRTVLFVSHSMQTISSLCERCFLLEAGQLVVDAGPTEAIHAYFNDGEVKGRRTFSDSGKAIGDEFVQLLFGEVCNSSGAAVEEIDIREPFEIRMGFRIFKDSPYGFVPNMHFTVSSGTYAFASVSEKKVILPPGDYVATCCVPGNLFNEGTQFIGLAMTSYSPREHIHFFESTALSFSIRDPLESDVVGREHGYGNVYPGVLRPRLNWNVDSL